MEGGDQPNQSRFGRSKGSADPLVGPLTLCFLMVAGRWVLMAVRGVHMVLREFGSLWALQSM
jgi:hypothetical protein